MNDHRVHFLAIPSLTPVRKLEQSSHGVVLLWQDPQFPPPPPSSSKKVERDPEPIMDQVDTLFLRYTYLGSCKTEVKLHDLINFNNVEWRNFLYPDPFDDINSEKGKIKDSKILIDEPTILENNDLLPLSPVIDSTLHEELSEVDTFPSSPSGNEDKVFNPGILIHGITHFVSQVTQDKNLKMKTSSEASLILEESNFLPLPSDRELLLYLELIVIETLLKMRTKFSIPV
ncbi:hypothetical protein Tco_0704235 [Tanacetum coccineum]|uniref:Uncharacterized protein n=1 Tax=Tanacetum coccineum TaxID=301880 RepID=A0ABQ4Y135_9ASTR